MTDSEVPEHRSRPLRVVLTSHEPALGGGAELSLLELAAALGRDGRVEPTVVVPQEGPLAAALRDASVSVAVLPTRLWVRYPAESADDGALLDGLRDRAARSAALVHHLPSWVRFLRGARPDVVVTSTATTPLAAMACARLRVPHVWWVQEFVTVDHEQIYVWGEPISQWLMGRLSTAVVVNSQAVRAHYASRIDARKMRIVGYGIEGVSPTPNPVDLPTLRVLLLGRQTPRKGQALAVRAVGALRDAPVDVRLRLVGEVTDGYRGELQRLAEELGVADRVEVAGPTNRPHDEIERANVILMCSAHEAFGRVTVEALKHGRPVIGTRSGGTTELVDDDRDGLLFAPGDVEALAAALLRAATEPGLVARWSEHAANTMPQRFTLATEVDAFVDVLTAAAAPGSDGR